MTEEPEKNDTIINLRSEKLAEVVTSSCRQIRQLHGAKFRLQCNDEENYIELDVAVVAQGAVQYYLQHSLRML